jgi:bifunctional non-homologous end joining protein LigD
VGYTEPGGSRSHLGALLLAVEREGDLAYAGRVGTGFSDQSLRELHEKLVPLRQREPSVVHPPRGADARGVHWVKPRLVAEVAFTGFTDDGLLRHPTFQGLREDKPARDVKLEAPRPEYPLTHPDKVLYPALGVSKRELLSYYELVAERMLPHVANRPLTLVRCPNGQGKPCFFQKHPGAARIEGLRSIAIREKEGKLPYSVLDDAQGLFALVQLGALEIHTWGARADDFEHPDLLVFDLDPDPELEFKAVIRCAERLRALFASAKLESFVKTTGGKGLHVCIPFEPDLGWPEVKAFAERVAEALATESPDQYVATVSKAKRTGKIFIDYLRNGRGATFVAPYSTRNHKGATVAAPLEWDELDARTRPDAFTVRNIAARLSQLKVDPFQRMATVRQRLRPKEIE